MEKQYFVQLLNKYFNGESTFEEDELIFSYYNLFENEPDVLALLNREKKDEIKNEIYAAIQKNIAPQENRHARVRSIPAWVIRSAAAAVLVMVCLSVTYLLYHKKAPEQYIAAKTDNKRQNRVFHLPDGSMVILNHGSSLNYAPGFDHSATREVYLEGQAYFDIHHDPFRPFIVHTENLLTTVLGTAFNMKAVKGDQQITVTVTRGRVRVGDQYKIFDLLTPDQQIVYNKANGNAVKNIVHAGDFLQWKDQEDLAIDNVTFEETAKLLEDKFKLTISLKDPALKNSRFTTVLLKNEKLEEIITTICDFNGAIWEYNNDKTVILISKKKSHKD